MGAMASIGQNGTSNLKHVIFNNGVHDSVGGQPTIAGSSKFSFPKIAIGCGYKNVNIDNL
jgi:phosphonopyruvate decarboxylase